MKLALMQPYLFPYIGYYQLAYHSDFFLFYDDVTYIKGGYINRNNILTKNGKHLFTLPIHKASSFTLIKDLEYTDKTGKLLSTIRQNYSKAPFFDEVFPIIEKVICYKDRSVSKISALSIIEVFKYLGLDFKFDFTSNIDYERDKSAKEKIYNLCHIYNCNNYVNTLGGVSLYDKEEFKNEGISLNFIEFCADEYYQFNNKDSFISHLSIIDVMMNESKENIISMIEKNILK
ncbi:MULTISPECIES: WbqC family protein [Vibrio]|uniref:WbqC family protein n=1 Tax=Vibrio TaxID=662 RepID=UPI001A8C3A1E|nr:MULTISPECIES: WbqC family protein [Vibrio]MBO0198048.1 WbqC family protein [Vibrio alginolyticus]MCR9641849.1 WbqC family protein [Vibrio alginolyticus]MDW1579712.1 WbqC family protein [Vibrio sp. Vb2897]MDW1585867.1 WbqC family protein [Vibrio sp. Vb2910]MDW1594836.1 WbqC family protein [Vibrio sp. Vb2911]